MEAVLQVGMVTMFLFALSCSEPDGGDKAVETGAPETAVLDWNSPEEWGPLQVGALTMEWTDSRGKEMVAEVWYPAVPDSSDVPEPYPPLGLAGEAFRRVDANTAYGPYPLIAFSHGYGGIRFQSIYLTEFLASHGFVVVSAQHRYNTFLDLNDDHLLDIVVQRPGDVIESVDELFRRVAVPDNRLFGLVDNEEYAVVGHSFGALTSMMVGGGVINLDGLLARCDSGRGRLCGTVTQLNDELLEQHRMTDSRAVLTIPMSPGMWYAFGSDGETATGLEWVRHPLVLGGDADPVLRYDEEILPSYANMASPKTLVNFHGTGHYAFSNMCDLAPFFTDECDGVDAGWSDVNEVQRLSRTIVLAHIRHVMLGEDRDLPFTAAQWLKQSEGVTVVHE